jgi:hypothetical protein
MRIGRGFRDYPREPVHDNFRSFLKVHHYNNQQQLIADLGERVIDPAEKWRSR